MKGNILIAVVGGLGLALGHLASPVHADEVLFCADWALYGKHTPYVVARDKGFFKEEGIDIRIQRGYGSGDTTKRAAAQDCAYGMASVGPVAFGLNRGLAVKVIGILAHKFQGAIYSFEDAGIRRPKDLVGKRLTPGPKSTADYAMFPVFAKANGINMTGFNWVFMDHSIIPSSLGAGTIDAALDFHTQIPRYRKVAKQSGKNLMTMLWADHGLDIYSSALVTSTKNVSAAKSDPTRRFVKSVYRGIAWTLAHPDEGIRIFLKGAPEQTFETIKGTLDIFMEHLFDGLSDKQGIGHVHHPKMEKTMRVTVESKKQTLKVNVRDTYTNEYVDALPKEIRFARPKS